MKKRITIAVLAFAGVLLAAASAGLNEQQRARAAGLQRILLAPCCWSEPVSTHRSEVALEMRAEINRMVGEGKSDRDVIDFYKNRYGMRILVEPEGERSFWMHLVPPVAILGGLVWVLFVIHRWLKRRPASSEG